MWQCNYRASGNGLWCCNMHFINFNDCMNKEYFPCSCEISARPTEAANQAV